MTTKLPRKPNDTPIREYKRNTAVLPVDLTQATWGRLEALIRQVVSECLRAQHPDGEVSHESILDTPSPSLRTQLMGEKAREEVHVVQEPTKPAVSRPRRTYGSHVQEVNEEGNWVTIS